MPTTKQYLKNETKWDADQAVFGSETYPCTKVYHQSGSWIGAIKSIVIVHHQHTAKSRFSIAEDVGWVPLNKVVERARQKFEYFYTETCESSALNIRETEDQFTISKRRFKNLIPRLINEHAGKYLAFIGNNPPEIGENEDELFDRVTKKYGDVPMCIGKIVETEKLQIDMTSPKYMQ